MKLLLLMLCFGTFIALTLLGRFIEFQAQNTLCAASRREMFVRVRDRNLKPITYELRHLQYFCILLLLLLLSLLLY